MADPKQRAALTAKADPKLRAGGSSPKANQRVIEMTTAGSYNPRRNGD